MILCMFIHFHAWWSACLCMVGAWFMSAPPLVLVAHGIPLVVMVKLMVSSPGCSVTVYPSRVMCPSARCPSGVSTRIRRPGHRVWLIGQMLLRLARSLTRSWLTPLPLYVERDSITVDALADVAARDCLPPFVCAFALTPRDHSFTASITYW